MKYVLFFAAALFIIACGSNSETKTDASATPETTVATDTTASAATPSMTCSNKTCPGCGMELNGKCADTCSYEGKTIGFCSKECKEECMKDPKKEKIAACCKKEAEAEEKAK